MHVNDYKTHSIKEKSDILPYLLCDHNVANYRIFSLFILCDDQCNYRNMREASFSTVGISNMLEFTPMFKGQYFKLKSQECQVKS